MASKISEYSGVIEDFSRIFANEMLLSAKLTFKEEDINNIFKQSYTRYINRLRVENGLEPMVKTTW